MKKLCVCIPTYNRHDSIERKLSEELPFMSENDVDVIIYDSSINDDTFFIWKKYHKQYGDNLKYVRIDSTVPSNVKVYNIFEQMSESEYEYIWMIHDHTICAETALDQILEALNEKTDFYLLNMQSDKYSIHFFASAEELLADGAWRLNSFGASILRRDTFLNNVDWEYMSDKYNNEKTLNYSHIGFYFEQAAHMKNFRACKINFDRKFFLDFLRDTKTSWCKDTLRICLECWGNVITALPDTYKNKTETLRTQDKWFLSKYSLITYKENGFYGFGTFLKYKKWIKLIYPEDYFRDMLISLLPASISRRIYVNKLTKSAKTAAKNSEKVYVYGAGRHAMECKSFLDDSKIKYDGFLVTNIEGNPSSIDGVDVYQASSRLLAAKCIVIVAVLSEGAPKVAEYVRSLSENAIIINFN